MLFTVLPQEKRKSTVFALVFRNYTFDAPNQYFCDFQQLIIEQDTAIVKSQKLEELSLDLQAELYFMSDRISIA